MNDVPKTDAERQAEAIAALQRKRGYAVLDLVTLTAMLRLPPGIVIEDVVRDEDDRWTGCVKLVLSGDDMPDGTETLNVPTRTRLTWVPNGRTIDDVECQIDVPPPAQGAQPKPPPT